MSGLIYKKFYIQNDNLKNISADIPRDTVFVLDGIKNGFLNHVQIGPVNREEALKYFNTSFKDSKIDVGENNLFVDVDVFVNEKLTPDNTLKKLDEAIKENLRITSQYLDYLTKP